MRPRFLAQSAEETIRNRAREQVRTTSRGMGSHSVWICPFGGNYAGLSCLKMEVLREG